MTGRAVELSEVVGYYFRTECGLVTFVARYRLMTSSERED